MNQTVQGNGEVLPLWWFLLGESWLLRLQRCKPRLRPHGLSCRTALTAKWKSGDSAQSASAGAEAHCVGTSRVKTSALAAVATEDLDWHSRIVASSWFDVSGGPGAGMLWQGLKAQAGICRPFQGTVAPWQAKELCSCRKGPFFSVAFVIEGVWTPGALNPLEHTGGHTGRRGGTTAFGDEIFIAFCISQTPNRACKDADEDTPP